MSPALLFQESYSMKEVLKLDDMTLDPGDLFHSLCRLDVRWPLRNRAEILLLQVCQIVTMPEFDQNQVKLGLEVARS